MQTLKIRDVMTPQVELIDSHAVLVEAARKMRDHDIGALPVEKNDKMIGMITDRDVAIRAVAESKDPLTETVENSMTGGIEYCFDDQPIGEISEMMSAKQLRRLPVVDRDKKLVGIVSLGDLSQKASSSEAAEVLEHISEPQ
ncbi:MAG: CBS domain-containing protein [Rhodospirillales bacterium]